MFDLFGEQITAPQCTTSALLKGINAAQGFAEWWQAWPTGPRKAGKQQSLDKWARYGCAAHAAHVLAYTEWMKTQNDWLKDNGAFVCAPVVFLNKQGWIDWQPEPERPKRPDILAELKAHKGSKPSAAILAELKRVRNA